VPCTTSGCASHPGNRWFNRDKLICKSSVLRCKPTTYVVYASTTPFYTDSGGLPPKIARFLRESQRPCAFPGCGAASPFHKLRSCGLGPWHGNRSAGSSFAPRQPIRGGRGLLLGSGSFVGCVAVEPEAVHICSARRALTPGHLQQTGGIHDLHLSLRLSLHTHQDR
jgi:hypothetical protein